MSEIVPELLNKALKVEEIFNKEVEKARNMKGKKVKQQNLIKKLKDQKKIKIKKIKKQVQLFFTQKLQEQAPLLLKIFQEQVNTFQQLNQISNEFV